MRLSSSFSTDSQCHGQLSLIVWERREAAAPVGSTLQKSGGKKKNNKKKNGSEIAEFGRFKWARARDGNVEGRDANQAQIKEEERDYKEVTPA